MRVGIERRLRIGDAHRRQHLDGALAGLFLGETEVRPDVLGHLDVDPEQWVKRGGRVLGDQGHLLAPDLAQLAAPEPEKLSPFEADAPRSPRTEGQKAEQGQGREGLARAALPRDPEDLPLADGEGDAVDGPADPVRRTQGHGEVPDLEHGARARGTAVGAHLRIIRAVRGSSMSRSASPTKLKASTTVRMASPGNRPIQ